MIEHIVFRNFRILRDARLQLGPFTLLMGQNGSGKTTALQSLHIASHGSQLTRSEVASFGAKPKDKVEIVVKGSNSFAGVTGRVGWDETGALAPKFEVGIPRSGPFNPASFFEELAAVPYYDFRPAVMASATPLEPRVKLAGDGSNLAAFVDNLRDEAPERFEALNRDFVECHPEYDRILFETPQPGCRALVFRTRNGGHPVPAARAGHGSVLMLGLLALGHQPHPAPVITIEAPERGVHPRLLKNVRDALHRLSHPAQFEDDRPAVQVIATSYCALMLDFFRDHLDEVLLANRSGLEARFIGLAERQDLEKMLQDSRLSDLWYSGVLGGVPGMQ